MPRILVINNIYVLIDFLNAKNKIERVFLIFSFFLVSNEIKLVLVKNRIGPSFFPKKSCLNTAQIVNNKKK